MSGERSRSTERDILAICWKPVLEDPSNFDAWTHLLQCVEQLDETKAAREAFDDFLGHFPYCYGYWRKYAEFERRHKHLERATEVYERGVGAIALSVDLWLSYLAFYKDFVKDADARERRVRYLYERAISAAGLEFRSDKLWEDYIQWELSQHNYKAALSLYDRVLKIPTQLYSSHFDRLQDFVNGFAPDKILADEEYDAIYKEVSAAISDRGVDVYVVEEVCTAEEGAAAEADDVKPATTTEYRKKYNDEALKLFRVAVLDKRRRIHLYTEQEVSKRWPYEDAIKRPYFHVKPLERAQLKNWRAYLDFEMSLGIGERIVTLFERCLIACALYEDIWIKYARYAESTARRSANESSGGGSETARAIYKRACGVHLLKKPNAHLAWSAFEEKTGDVEAAREVLRRLDERCPGLLLVSLRRIGLERRAAVAQSTAADPTDFSALTARFERHLRDPRTPTKVCSFYALKFARFQAKYRGDRRLAEKILKDALARDKDNSSLYLQLIDLAYSADPFSERAVLDAFDLALQATELPDFERVRFSQRKLEFLEDLGTDVGALQDHFEYHLKLYKATAPTGTKRKSDAAPPRSNGNEKRPRMQDGGEAAVEAAHHATYYYPPPTNHPAAAADVGYNQYGSYYYPPPY